MTGGIRIRLSNTAYMVNDTQPISRLNDNGAGNPYTGSYAPFFIVIPEIQFLHIPEARMCLLNMGLCNTRSLQKKALR